MTYATNAEFFRFGVQIDILAPVCEASIDECCPICRETWYPNHKSRRRNSIKNSLYTIERCSHRFCIGCLESWLEKNQTCPMCRQVLFDIWQDNIEDIKCSMDVVEYLDVADVGVSAATRMNEGRYRCDRKNSWEMIREVKRVMFGTLSGMRTIVRTSTLVGR
jgi:hypothetical protein